MPPAAYSSPSPPPVHLAYQPPVVVPSAVSSVSSVSSPISASVSGPTTATSAVSAIDDILHSFSTNNRPTYHSTPPASTPSSSASSPTPIASLQHADVLRQREQDKLLSLVASVRNSRTAVDLSSILSLAFLQTQPTAFLDVARYFLAVDGLPVLVDWLEQCYAAFLRDTAPQQLPPLPPPDTATIPPQLVDSTLVTLLQAMYRLAVYQRMETRARMPRRSSLLGVLHAMLTHPREEVRELALRLFEHYQVLFGGVDVILPPVVPPGIGGGQQPPLSVTGAMRLEFEIFLAGEQQKLLLLSQQQQQQHLSAHSTHPQPQPAVYSISPDPTATLGPPLYTSDRSISPSAFLSVSPMPPTTERSPSPFRPVISPVQPLTNGATVGDATSVHVRNEFVKHDHNDGHGGVADLMTFPLPLHPSPTLSIPAAPTLPPMGSVVPLLPPMSPDRMITVSASLMCPICEEVATSDLANYQHVLSIHQRLLCVACALMFTTEDELYSHFESHPSNDTDAASSHACGLCGLSFTTEEALSLHHHIHVMNRRGKDKQQLIVKKKKRKQPVAEEKESGGSPTKKAKKDKGGEEDDEEDGADEEGGGGPGARFPPAICSHPSHPMPLSFACDEDLQSHSGTAHSIYYCFAIDCGAKLSTADELAEHLRTHVQATVAAAGGSTSGTSLPGHCVYCGVVWSKKVTKTEHMHRHDKPFRCSFCPMRFARRTRWRAHIKRKHPQEWAEHTPLLETSK